MLQFYHSKTIIVDEEKSKIYSVAKILFVLCVCAAISIIILAFAVLYIFGIGQCPKEGCQVSFWDNAAASIALISPLLIFSFGSYLARTAIYNLSKSKISRIFLFVSFAAFPLLLLCGLIACFALSKN